MFGFKKAEKEEGNHSTITCIHGNGDALDVLFVESDVAFINRLIPELNGNQSFDHSGYLNIVTAQCLRDAIDALETRKFDVIVTDIGLSDASGMLVLEELIEFGQNTPIIVLTDRKSVV